MDQPVVTFGLTLVVAYTTGYAIYPLLRASGRISVVAVAVACMAVPGCLFLIPCSFPVYRGVAALCCADLSFRLIDLTRQNFHGDLHSIGWSRYFSFLMPFPILLVVFGQKKRRLFPEQRSIADLFRLGWGVIGVTAGFVLVFAAQRSYVLQSSFVLDHVAKVVLFLITVESLANAMCGIERLAGYATVPIVDRPFLSATPAQFWRRWNNRVQPWLYWNVFLPAGGRHSPARGVWATFFVSALMHEIAFDIATSRITGYQFTFFLIQAPAVMFSPVLDRLAQSSPIIGAAAARTATVVWMGGTSIFFFHGLNLVFPFVYASEPWLP
jgi:hypothetical protein